MIKILCIGHASYDITYTCSSFVKENSKYETKHFTECGGGPASTAAYLLSSWGIKTAFAGAVGNDYYGKRIIDQYKKAETDISLLEQCKGKTNLSFIIANRKNGSRTLINRKDSKLKLNMNSKNLKKIKPEILLFDGHEPEASVKALESFPEAVSILDAGSLREGTRFLSEMVNYLVASEKFALSFCKTEKITTKEDMRKCLKALYRINKNPVITLGEKGLCYLKDTTAIHQKAYPVKAVDTTGAGDIFHGSFAYCIFNRMNLDSSLLFSQIAAALSVTRIGGSASVPALKDVHNIFVTYRKAARY